jgi:hypothetical protein
VENEQVGDYMTRMKYIVEGFRLEVQKDKNTGIYSFTVPGLKGIIGQVENEDQIERVARSLIGAHLRVSAKLMIENRFCRKYKRNMSLPITHGTPKTGSKDGPSQVSHIIHERHYDDENIPRSNGHHVPGGWDRLSTFVREEKDPNFGWEHAISKDERLIKLQNLVLQHGCAYIFDQRKGTKTSFLNFGSGKTRLPKMFIGGKGSYIEISSTVLHELGHLIIIRNIESSKSTLLDEEKAAWELAQKLANQYRLPLESKFRRRALFSYKYGEQAKILSGSRQKNKKRPASKLNQLQCSKRSKGIKINNSIESGKKGKRIEKRALKRATARHERKEKIEL